MTARGCAHIRGATMPPEVGALRLFEGISSQRSILMRNNRKKVAKDSKLFNFKDVVKTYRILIAVRMADHNVGLLHRNDFPFLHKGHRAAGPYKSYPDFSRFFVRI